MSVIFADTNYKLNNVSYIRRDKVQINFLSSANEVSTIALGECHLYIATRW